MHSHGVFILISTRPIAKDKILPLYYTRQQIEQVFDLCKNNTNLLPLRVQTEETFRGHLLLAFTASVICRKLQEDLKDTKYTPENAFLALRNHKCKVYEDHVLTSEAAKGANDIYKKFKIKVAHRYDIDSNL
jgi:transposase